MTPAEAGAPDTLCPYCGATPGQPCHRRSRKPHKARPRGFRVRLVDDPATVGLLVDGTVYWHDGHTDRVVGMATVDGLRLEVLP